MHNINDTEETPSKKTSLLAYPLPWFIERETLQAVNGSVPLLQDFYLNHGENDPLHTPLNDLITEVAKEVYSVPLFSRNFCRILLDEVKGCRFSPNPDEDSLRQIPEVVLQEQLPEIYDSLMHVVGSVINPILTSIWGQQAVTGSIQVANYNLGHTKKGAWHHDTSSDFTIVVPLNTGDYEGGGTEFWGRGTIAPLPTGNALIFPGLTHLHRGLEVDSGDRYLLVFWLTIDDRNCA